jgi:hypothetical protein
MIVLLRTKTGFEGKQVQALFLRRLSDLAGKRGSAIGLVFSANLWDLCETLR